MQPQQPNQNDPFRHQKAAQLGQQATAHHEASTTHTSTTSSLEDRQKQLRKSQIINRVKSGFGLASFFVTAFLFALVINRFVLQSYQVVGTSMSPTLEENDWLIISKLGKTWSNVFSDSYLPSRGDVIVFNDPRQGVDKSLIKRVIALPGERVELADDGLRVYNEEFQNGFDPDEDYKDNLYIPTTETIRYYADALNNGPLVVPEGEIFVAGDNRAKDKSLDSRGSLGTVPTENITGVLKARLFPVGDIDLTF